MGHAGEPSHSLPTDSQKVGLTKKDLNEAEAEPAHSGGRVWANKHSGSVKVGPMNTRTGLTPTLPMLV